MRKISAKQLNKELTTWKKNDREIYNQIMIMAREQGVALKSGGISISKKNTKKVEKLVKQYLVKYGSYSSYERESKKSFQSYVKKELKRKQLSGELNSQEEYNREKKRLEKQGAVNYRKKQDQLNDLIKELFNQFPSETAYEELQYITYIPQNIALERLNEEIANGKIAPPVQEYLNKYESYEPPF